MYNSMDNMQELLCIRWVALQISVRDVASNDRNQRVSASENSYRYTGAVRCTEQKCAMLELWVKYLNRKRRKPVETINMINLPLRTRANKRCVISSFVIQNCTQADCFPIALYDVIKNLSSLVWGINFKTHRSYIELIRTLTA